MMNINEYFTNLYNTVDFETANNEEMTVFYDMTEEEFTAWAEEHNIDLDATDEHGIAYTQYWAWNFED